MKTSDRDEVHIPCWFCGRPLRSTDILRDGILRGRPTEQGGPYRILACPNCDRHNLCEKTPRGRWFASPNVRLSLLEYLFSRVLAPAAEDFLVAVSWFRDNEERRRIFFERDGDDRYTGKHFLLRLWPTARGEANPQDAHEKTREKTSGQRERDRQRQEHRERERERERARDRKREREEPRDQKRGRRLVTPYELLGVTSTASRKEITLAFQKLALHYHPDKVYHRGEEFRRMAHEKFTELKDAYETLLRRQTGNDP